MIENNWLSDVDLGTYKITLYLIHPDIWNSSTQLVNDDALLGKKAVIISESGVESSYSIDNLVMRSAVVPSRKAGFTSTGIMQFELHEPLGFSFLESLQSLAPTYKFTTLYNANFALKIEFGGRDVITGAPKKYPGVFIYRLAFKDVTAKLGPDGTHYSIVAYNMQKKAVVESGIETDLSVQRVTTVSDFAKQLEFELNKAENELRGKNQNDTGTSKKTYRVTFDDTADIKKTSSTRSFNVASAVMGGAGTEASSGDNASSGPKDTDRAVRDYTLDRNSSITAYIQNTINKNTPSLNDFIVESQESLNIHPVITVTPEVIQKDGVDPSTNMSEMEINFVIGVTWVYSTVTKDATEYTKFITDEGKQQAFFETVKNSAICKKYEYLYTGNNTEVLDFNLEYNGLFRVTLDPARASSMPNTVQTYGTSVTTVDNSTQQTGKYLSDIKPTNLMPLDASMFEYVVRSSDAQQTSESINSNSNMTVGPGYSDFYQRSADFLSASITVKGDPFWMGTPDAELGGSTEATTVRDFKGHELSIAVLNMKPDPSMADPFNRQTGGIEFSSSGVYRVVSIESNFQQGKFTQTLETQKNTTINPYIIATRIAEL